MVKDKCLIAFVLDRSGSMAQVKPDVIGGFNQFVTDQLAVPGEAEMYLVQFDNQYEVVFENFPLKDVPKMDDKTFVPRGTTALWDAVGRTIDDIGKILDKADDNRKPEKVMLVVFTDGHENASHEYTAKQVADRVTHQQSKYGWEVIFLGAGIDAWAVGGQLGISKDLCFNVARTGAGVQAAYHTASLHTTRYRTGNNPDDINWSNKEKGEGSNAV